MLGAAPTGLARCGRTRAIAEVDGGRPVGFIEKTHKVSRLPQQAQGACQCRMSRYEE